MTSDTMDVSDHVQAEVRYIVKDSIHDEEKPYQLAFNAKGVVPQTNVTEESHHIKIYNFRGLQRSDNYNNFGISVMVIDDQLTPAEYQDENIVKKRFYPSIERTLWKAFPGAAAIRLLEHDLRKRDPNFTGLEGIYEAIQPATGVHIDFSPHSADRTAHAYFKDLHCENKRLITVNFWKSFQGPGNDWPLALCNFRTINYGADCIAIDRVYHDSFTESQRLHFNPEHEWYYVKDLKDHEVLMFRQTDSTMEGGGGVAHTSFKNQYSDINASPRESIELRAFVFYA